MTGQHQPRRTPYRRGAAAVEFAILLPFLILLIVIAVDFARIFYHTQIITNAARAGALYGSKHPDKADDQAGIQAAALADTTNLDPATTTVSPRVKGTDAAGHPYIEVTVKGSFSTVTNYPGIESPLEITRTVRMRITPKVPKNS